MGIKLANRCKSLETGVMTLICMRVRKLEESKCEDWRVQVQSLQYLYRFHDRCGTAKTTRRAQARKRQHGVIGFVVWAAGEVGHMAIFWCYVAHERSERKFFVS